MHIPRYKREREQRYPQKPRKFINDLCELPHKMTYLLRHLTSWALQQGNEPSTSQCFRMTWDNFDF